MTAFPVSRVFAIALFLAAPVFPLHASSTDPQEPAAKSYAADAAEFNYYGRWSRGSPRLTLASGAIIEFAYTGRNCVLRFDVRGFTYFPAVFVQVDNGPIVRTALSESVDRVEAKPIFARLPTGEPPYAEPVSRHHLVRAWMATSSLYKTPAAGTGWTTLNGGIRFLGVELDADGRLETVPYIADQIEFLGDSMIQGQRLLYTGTNNEVGNQLPFANWPQLAADLLGLKPLASGFGGQAMAAPGTNGVPPAPAAFPWVCAGVRWEPPVEPRAVVIYQGTNGLATPEEFERLYVEYLRILRGAYPSALIFAVCPHQRPRYAASIKGAVTTLNDSRIVFLDYSIGVIEHGDMSDSPQGHLNPGGAVRLATRLAGDLAPYLRRR